MKFIIAAVVASASLAFAQNQTFPCLTESQFDTQVPACAAACQHLALTSDGCPYEDVGCHCLKTGLIGNIIEPCLANFTCTTADLISKL
jgi:CFEM domain